MIWVAADCYFEYNPELKIENWNQIVAPEDEVIILGHFYKENFHEILEKLNGTKVIADYSTNPDYRSLSKESLCKEGFSRLHHSYSYSINDGLIIHILPDKDCLEKIANSTKLCGASARSITGQKEVLERRVLSLSYQDWGNAPIKYSDIPTLYKNMELFNQMGDDGFAG